MANGKWQKYGRPPFALCLLPSARLGRCSVIPVTTNWQNAAAGALKPAHILTIYNPDTSVLIQLSREVAIPGFPPICANHWINDMSGGGAKGDILSGNGTNSALSVGVLDKNWAISDLLSSTTIEGLTATLTTGFVGLALADFTRMGTYIIDGVKSDKSNLRYTISLRDPGLKLQNLAYLVGDDGYPTSSNNPYTLEGDPMSLLLDVLENQCGYPAGSINTTAITNYQNNLFYGLTMKFSLSQSPQAKAFLTQELFSPLAGYGFWNYAGQYTPYFPLPLGAPATPFALTTRNILSPIPTYDQGPFVASLVHMMDYNGSDYDTAVANVYGPAETAYGLRDLTSKQSRGLRSADGGVLYAMLSQQAIFRRYGMKPWILQPHCPWSTLPLELGDRVAVTHPNIPAKGVGMGITNRWFEVTGKTPDWSKGEFAFELLDVNWLNRAPLQIAPNGTPAWSSASTAQQAEYGYIDEGQLIY